MKLTLTALFFCSLLVPPLWSHAQSQRGQGQRGQGVRIKVETGQEIDLYDESHALVIGVGKYTDGWRELPGTERDAEAVSAVLRRQGFEVTVALNPTSAQLNDALSAFISDHGLQERNRLLIYFAGHGHTEALADGRELGYIVPADSPLPERNPQLFSRRAISMDEIEAKALRIRSKHALFIFDSCFSGSIFEVRAERNVPPEIESKTAAPVRLFITAGTKNQTVPDDSVFRLYFVRAFEQREGDLNRDGFITGEELGMYLSGRVASDSRDTQTPRYGKIKNARLNLGDVVFSLPRLEPQPPTPAPLDPAAIELAMWQSAEKSNTIADYEEYLRQYKQGRFAGMAHNRIAALRGTAANTAPGRVEAPSPTPAQGLNPEAIELAMWQSAEKSNTIADYEEYLRQYKQGRFAGMANNRIAVLRGTAANTAPGRVEAPSQPSMRYARVSGKKSLPLVTMSFATAKVDANGRVTRLPGQSANGYIEQLNRFVKLEMVEVPGGSFMMGTPDREERISKDEQPQHRVTIRDFYCGKYEVTQGQWIAVMGSLPPKLYGLGSEFKGDHLPVVGISWDEAKEFIVKLNRLTGGDYRLLSEAEWEYAARAGATTHYAFGDGFSAEIINNNAKVERVGGRGVANAFGLFDMHGNAWEWCEDDYHDSYRGAPDDGKAWMDIPNRALIRVYRDSSWIFSADGYRSARRNFVHHANSYDYLGFRLSRTAQ